MSKALLVVSFGTTHEDTRIKNIELLENELHSLSPDMKLYRAWTSKIIMKILKQRDNVQIDDVKTALARMLEDGIREVYVQSTHVVNGIEYEMLMSDIALYKDSFDKIVCAKPLLSLDEDYEELVEAYRQIIAGDEAWKFDDSFVYDKADTAVVFMGHGSEHHANAAYAALDYRFKDSDMENVFIGTVEAYPTLDTIIKKLKQTAYKKIVLTPLMLVAGDHAKNDMASDEEDSWYTLLKNEGYEIAIVLKGMGEYEPIRNIYKRHTENIIGDTK